MLDLIIARTSYWCKIILIIPPFSYSIPDTIYFFFILLQQKSLTTECCDCVSFMEHINCGKSQPQFCIDSFTISLQFTRLLTHEKCCILPKKTILSLFMRILAAKKTIECSPFRRCITLIRKKFVY